MGATLLRLRRRRELAQQIRAIVPVWLAQPSQTVLDLRVLASAGRWDRERNGP
jgi:hypothetical protein